MGPSFMGDLRHKKKGKSFCGQLCSVLVLGIVGWWPAKPSSNIAHQARVLVPLHGEIAEPVHRDITRTARCQHPEVRKQVQGLFVSRAWLFIGYTPSDELFEHLVDQFGHPPGEGNAPSHLALVPHVVKTRSWARARRPLWLPLVAVDSR